MYTRIHYLDTIWLVQHSVWLARCVPTCMEKIVRTAHAWRTTRTCWFCTHKSRNFLESRNMRSLHKYIKVSLWSYGACDPQGGRANLKALLTATLLPASTQEIWWGRSYQRYNGPLLWAWGAARWAPSWGRLNWHVDAKLPFSYHFGVILGMKTILWQFNEKRTYIRQYGDSRSLIHLLWACIYP